MGDLGLDHHSWTQTHIYVQPWTRRNHRTSIPGLTVTRPGLEPASDRGPKPLQISPQPCVLVSLATVMKRQTLGGLNNRYLFLYHLEAWSLTSKSQQIQFFMRAFLLACRWMATFLMSQCGLEKERKEERTRVHALISLTLLIRALINPFLGPSLHYLI